MFPIIVASFLLIVMDLSYISVMSKSYKQMIATVQSGKPSVFRPFFGLLCYAFILATFIAVIVPYVNLKLGKRSYTSIRDKIILSLQVGGLIGLVVYGVYDMTTLTLFKEYSVTLAVLDIIWGAFLHFFVTFVYVYLHTVGSTKS